MAPREVAGPEGVQKADRKKRAPTTPGSTKEDKSASDQGSEMEHRRPQTRQDTAQSNEGSLLVLKSKREPVLRVQELQRLKHFIFFMGRE
ncbi:hypothetical protein NDU88_004057 [Pleurodeles waltl]|uniref:Uncharacterized protein n=1 Tax=Pleurodeles waltl TaxID=8319 RepID=A0AAV7PBD5_PLEWA|nr:hypothetical protein NDU88_004057 [Pleurodeles waltl]